MNIGQARLLEWINKWRRLTTLSALKRSHLLACIVLTISPITGCSLHSGYWPSRSSDDPIAKFTCSSTERTTTQQTRTILYDVEGHYNTTELIARMAGYSKIDALRLAYFSQAPDDKAFLYSAPWVAVWALLPRIFFWSYHPNVMNVLHSLHNGDHAQVIERRHNLKDEITFLVRERNKTKNVKDDWKIGFLIHALADSYAHTYGAMANLHGYNEFIGHALDYGAQGNKPDEIVANNNYLIYIEYVNALFEALVDAKESNGKTKLKDFTETIKYKVEHDRITEEDFKTFVINYPVCGIAAEVTYRMGTSSAENIIDEWENEISFGNVNSFLGEVRYRL